MHFSPPPSPTGFHTKASVFCHLYGNEAFLVVLEPVAGLFPPLNLDNLPLLDRNTLIIICAYPHDEFIYMNQATQAVDISSLKDSGIPSGTLPF